MKNRVLSLLILVLMILTFSGCKDEPADGKMKIVTTIFPQYSFVKEIVKDNCNVELVLKPGQDSHNFDPSVATVLAINKADMFIYTGEYMETWANKIIKNLKENGPVVVESSKGIKFEVVEEHQDEHEEEESHEHEYDPHIWTNIKYSIIMVQNISSAICALDPDNSEFYKQNTDEYLKQLTSLDQQFQTLVDNSTNKTLYFVSPFSFYYFVKEYGLDYVSLYSTCSTEVEPTATAITQMISQIKANNVKYIYKKELVSSSVPTTIANNTNTTILTLHSAHNVTVDEFKNNISYLKIMQQNLEVLKVGLVSNGSN